MKVPKFLAVGLIAAGLVIGGSTVAHAATASPYVTVLWSYTGYPDLEQPQAFVNSYAGADLHAFDATLASVDSCGHAFQVDVYKVTDEQGRSWETLKESGSLQYAHDGGFLAYDAGVGTPYRVITPEEYPCTTPTPEPSPTTTQSSPEPSDSPTVTPSPSAPSTPTPSATSEPTPAPSSSTGPSPSASASSTPTPTSSPTATGTPSPTASATSLTPNSSPTSGTHSGATGSTTASSSTGELAYTGADPRPGIIVASVLIAAGIALIFFRRVRRA